MRVTKVVGGLESSQRVEVSQYRVVIASVTLGSLRSMATHDCLIVAHAIV
jgi:hypothetical protein